jgi:serine protease Do
MVGLGALAGRAGSGRRRLIAPALVVAVLVAGVAVAQDLALLGAEFDARGLSDPEKRLLQVGLAASGDYDGLIDGAWGAGSQAAFEHYVLAAGLADADGRVRNYHLAVLAAEADAFAAANGLSYRGGTPYGHLLLTPPGDFVDDPATGVDDLVLTARGLEIRTFSSEPDEAAELHDGLELRLGSGALPYLVRSEQRWVTAATTGGALVYARTDYSPGVDSFFTTLVSEGPGADRALYRVVTAAITDAATAELGAPGGALERVIAEGEALLAATAATPEAGLDAAEPPPPGPPAGDGSGTAFFVTDRDLVTAAHVIDGCRSVALYDGTPLAVVARHPSLDLALLASPRRSASFIPVGGAGAARLGQRIFVLGYPFFGTFGTALNMTGGNVSALSGIGDDAATLTISAPVQPGNSGGPLLARDGTVIGVVVARLDSLSAVEATGALPENINYAVSGPALVDFLAGAGVALPPAAAPAPDLDEGVPEAMQQAVVPVICHAA